MKYVAPIAATAGFSLEEMAAASGILGNAGIQGSQAGTALRGAISRLAAPVGAASTLMEELGVEVSNSDGTMKSFSEIIGQVETATAGMGDAQKLAAVKTLVGEEAASAFITLMDEGSESLSAYTQELENSGGTAETIAQKQLDNLNGKLTILKSGFEAMAIAIGSALIPAIEWLVGIVQSLVDWFNGLSPAMQSTIAIVAAIATGFALLMGPILILVAAIPAITAGFTAIATAVGLTAGSLAATIGIVIAVVAAIALIGAALVWAYNNVEWFRAGVDAAWAWIKEAWSVAVETVRQVTEVALEAVRTVISDVLAWAQAFWAENGAAILAGVIAAYEAIRFAIETAIEAVRAYIGEKLAAIRAFWDENGASIMASVQSAYETVKSYISTAVNAVVEFIGAQLAKIQQFWAENGEQIMRLVSEAWAVIKLVIDTAISIIVAVVKGGLGILKGVFQVVWPIISGLVQVAWELIKTVVSSGIDLVTGLVKAGMDLLEGDWSGAWGHIKDIASDIWSNIEDFFRNIDLYQIGKDIIQGLINGIGSMVSAAANAVKDVASSIKNGVTGFFDIRSPSRVMMDVGGDVGGGLAIGIADTIRQVQNAAGDLASAAMPAVPSTRPQASTFRPAEMRSDQPIVINMQVDGDTIASKTFSSTDELFQRSFAQELRTSGVKGV